VDLVWRDCWRWIVSLPLNMISIYWVSGMLQDILHMIFQIMQVRYYPFIDNKTKSKMSWIIFSRSHILK
jgi:hypothetical protein